jgi:hypothetical protein
MGLMHALGTGEVVRQHLDNPCALTLAQDSIDRDASDALVPHTIEIDRTPIARFQRVDRGSA